LKKQLEEKDNVLKTKNETQQQLQSAIDVLKNTEHEDRWTIQQLRAKEKHLQATNDDLTMTVKALEQMARGVDGEQKDVSICKLESFPTRNGLIFFRIPIYPTWFNVLLSAGFVSAYSSDAHDRCFQRQFHIHSALNCTVSVLL
jgi:hypothetical protein